jgi:hypothetical protein
MQDIIAAVFSYGGTVVGIFRRPEHQQATLHLRTEEPVPNFITMDSSE